MNYIIPTALSLLSITTLYFIKREVDRANSSTNKLEWITAFTKEALDLGVKERSISLNKQLGKVIDINQVQILNEASGIFVNWDSGRIVEGKTVRPLYSTDFLPCIAVLARAFPKNAKNPSHLLIHHVFQHSEYFSTTLTALVNKINKQGKIQLFISGGKEISEHRKEELYNIIENQKKNAKHVELEIAHDSFGICDLGQLGKEIGGKIYSESCLLSYVGFNDQQMPYQIVDVTCNHPYDKTKLQSVRWYQELNF